MALSLLVWLFVFIVVADIACEAIQRLAEADNRTLGATMGLTAIALGACWVLGTLVRSRTETTVRDYEKADARHCRMG